MAKRVAVIGAGASGLAAIKWTKETGMEPTCFERRDCIGGLWCYTDDSHKDQACVMKTTVINTSKEGMCFSDFPIPSEDANFMHNVKIMNYFKSYAKHFDLLRHIKFGMEILHIKRTKDFNTTGQWEIHYRNKKDGTTTTEVFDAVMICTGHHASENMPKFEGDDIFEGKIIHTHELKHGKPYEDQRVLVIGAGNSGADAAVEISRFGSQVYMAARSGAWVVTKYTDHGIPTDMIMGSRYNQLKMSLMGADRVNDKIEKQLNNFFDHQLYGLKPKGRFNQMHPMTSDDIQSRIGNGTVIVKGDVKRFLKRGVEFKDGSVIDDIDTIVYATGYIFGYPFLEEGVVDVHNNSVELFKYVFNPDLKPATLAIIGLVQPLGSTIPMAEIQSRYAARIFKGVQKLPSSEQMWADIRRKREEMAARYINCPRYTLQIDWGPYMDEMADLIGCKPDIKKLLFSDPKLAWAMFFGPNTPISYRVMGPQAWPGARKAVLETWDRIYGPFAPNKPMKEEAGIPWFYIFLFGALAVALKMFFF